MIIGVNQADALLEVARLQRRKHVRPVTRRASDVSAGEGVWQNLPDVNGGYVCTCEEFQSGDCEHVQARYARDMADAERRLAAADRKAARLDAMRENLDRMMAEDEREAIAFEGVDGDASFDTADFGRFDSAPVDLEADLQDFARRFLWSKSVKELRKMLTARRLAGEWTQFAHKERLIQALIGGRKP